MAVPTLISAQELAKTGRSADEIVPQGTEYINAEGDLNKDGRSDLVVYAQPVLAIYFANASGIYEQWKQYKEILPIDEEGDDFMIDIVLTVTARGTLMIHVGSFASASWTEVAIVAPVVAVGIGIVLYYSRDLNLLLAGSETARSLGVEVERVKRVLLLSTTLMVAFCVATCGVIGFVGLVVPHCLRLVLGPDNRRIVPCAIFAGGLFMLLCDTLARTLLMPAELPVGSLTALAGAPLFIYLLYKNKKRY